VNIGRPNLRRGLLKIAFRRSAGPWVTALFGPHRYRRKLTASCWRFVSRQAFSIPARLNWGPRAAARAHADDKIARPMW